MELSEVAGPAAERFAEQLFMSAGMATPSRDVTYAEAFMFLERWMLNPHLDLQQIDASLRCFAGTVLLALQSYLESSPPVEIERLPGEDQDALERRAVIGCIQIMTAGTC